jgi:hypothetical protein
MRSFEMRLQRVARVGGCIYGLPLLAAIGVMIATSRFENNLPAFVGFAVAMISTFAGLIHFERRRNQLAQESGIGCGSCSTPLWELNAKLALTTGRCAKCGEVVISDL